jgi:hypothetical protein
LKEKTEKQKNPKKQGLPVWAGGTAAGTRQADFALFMNIAVRFALLCMATAGIVLMFIQMYQIPVDTGAVIFRTVFASLFFNILFIFLRFRYALPFIGLISLIYWRVEDVWFNLGCLADYMLVYIDGGMLATLRFSSRDMNAVMNSMTFEFHEGLQKSVTFFAIAFALLFALTARGKYIGAILITAIILVVPGIASQKASFVPAMVMLAVSMLGLYSIWASQEQSFLKSMKKARRQKRWPFIPRIHRHAVNGAASACIALAACIVAQIILPEEKSRDIIDFWRDRSDDVVDWFRDVGDFFGGGFGSLGVPMLDTSGYMPMPGGGISASGTLSINNPTISRRQVLNVWLSDNDSPVYLRNGIGATFNAERGRWDVDGGGNRMRGFPDNFYPEHEYLVFRQKVPAGYAADSFIDRQRVDVEYLVRTPHVMLPTSAYIPGYKTDSRFNWRNDTILTKRGSNNPQTYVWDVLYPRSNAAWSNVIGDVQTMYSNIRALTQEEAINHGVTQGLPNIHEDYFHVELRGAGVRALRAFVQDYGITVEEYLHYLAEYEAMIWNTYTVTTESERENMRQMIGVVSGRAPFAVYASDSVHFINTAWGADFDTLSDYAKASAIEHFFKNNYLYSLTTDNNSGENTMLGNFMFETLSGHCALYATAMTLMMREMGVPARYVTGYVAGNGNGVRSGNRFMHTILERDLHAWVEVYFKGVGWLPFDPTPPIFEFNYLDAERESGNGSVNTTPRTTPPRPVTTPPITPPTERPTPTLTTPTTPEASAPDHDETTPTTNPASFERDNTELTLQTLMIALIVLLTTAFTFSVIMFARGLSRTERRRLAKYADLSECNTAREAYRFILRLLKIEGLTGAPGETPVKFAKRVDQAIQGHGLTPVIEAIEKLEFSKEELTADEYAKLSLAMAELYNQIVTSQRRLKRLARRIIALDIIK